MRADSTALVPLLFLLILFSHNSCQQLSKDQTLADDSELTALVKSKAKSADGQYISWKEHLIDDVSFTGIELSGSDGLVMADLDNDGFEDIVSVHESDTEYDGIAKGHIRIAFGSADPDQWELVTLAAGAEAGAAEDAAIGDINGDGFLDIVAACELAHLIYFENPGVQIRSSKWERLIPKITQNRGSYIRVFTADFNKDGKVEVIAANKGDQNATDPEAYLPEPISYFEITGDPLLDKSWVEHEFIRVKIPINSQPVDIDGDGDQDVIGGSRGERRLILFENVSSDSINFIKHDIVVAPSKDYEKETSDTSNWNRGITGFNMDFVDLNGDGRLDIALQHSFLHLVWLEQPSDWSKEWTMHWIGSTSPDQLVGLMSADINGDNYPDFMTGGYSRGERAQDGDASLMDPLGRMAWFENPGDISKPWIRHDISRRKRGMFDKFIVRDMDQDGDIDFVSTRGNSIPYDGVFWLEQIRSEEALPSFLKARENDSEEMPLPKE